MPRLQTAAYAEEAAGVSLDNTYTLLTMDAASGGGAKAPSPRQVFVGTVVVTMTSISGATTADVKITRDAAGDVPVTQADTAITIVTGETTSTSGSVVTSVNSAVLTDGAAFYVWVKLDAGTATSGASQVTWWEKA